MAEETLQTHPTEVATEPPPPAAEETETPPPKELESVPEPPLASVALDLQKDSPPPAEEKPKEAVTFIEKDTPLEPPPPEAPAAALDLQKDSPPPAEEKLKEAVTVIEKDTPLEPPPQEAPLAAENVTVTATSTATEKDTAAPASQPLAAALAVSQESESPKSQLKEVEKEKTTEKKKAPEALGSFKEESNKLSDLSDYERRALEEFKLLVQEALNSGQFLTTSSSEASKLPEQVSIWGVPLLQDDRSDVILLKFLRARDFKVKESFAMLKNTIKWRRDFNVDELVKEDLGDDLEKVVFMQGHDKEGHPVCYNVYGEFQNKELYAKTFSDEEKRMKFLRWRIQFLERSIRKLDFSPGGINTIFQVSDLKNSPGPGKRELRIATKQALQILQDNYPEFVAKQVFINVPWWYLAFYTMISPFLTQRTKSKFVFAGPTKTAETLFKYILPEQVPTQYGGLSVDNCECNPEFTIDDPATEITVKPATKQTVEIIVNEKCTLVWELRVVGWEVSYSAEYVPNSERGYTVIIQKARKMIPTDEPVVSNSFNVSELGKILLTIDNPTAKKKKLLYRFKVMPLPTNMTST
ncbi:Phosphatidylinositol transfer protein SEC14 [Handroanthus impetiginosus]|uniref:Phosphatidylinositol transfer protein SEC14 n=1 Tax=Handroanthus impetiginosus TaxID=429701 RepID=A0A2G9H1L4_9LAMI|nr:Phosphatidylinositol transfer protein SEC14 [Handroanthus impetiginosus]